MAKSIAGVWDAKLEYVESTYGNSVLDLQTNKVDIAFSLNPTPQRALAIGFTQPMIVHPSAAWRARDSTRSPGTTSTSPSAGGG